MSLNKPFFLKSGHFRPKTFKNLSFSRHGVLKWVLDESDIMSHLSWMYIFGRSSFSSSVDDTTTWRRRRFKPKLNFERECRFWVFGESRSSVRPWHPRDYNIVSTCHVMTSLIHLMQIIWYSFTIYNHMTNPSKFNTWKFLKFWSKISFWRHKKVHFFRYFR